MFSVENMRISVFSVQKTRELEWMTSQLHSQMFSVDGFTAKCLVWKTRELVWMASQRIVYCGWLHSQAFNVESTRISVYGFTAKCLVWMASQPSV